MILFVICPSTIMAQEKLDENSSEYKDISSLFVCPECNTVGAELNERFKAEILELMNEGYTKSEIKEYFVEIYGEAILAAPEKSGFSLVAWVTPLFALAIAGGVIFLLIRKSVRKSSAKNELDDSSHILDRNLDEYVLHTLIEEERKKRF